MATKHSMIWILNKIIADNIYKGSRKHASNKEVGKKTQARRGQAIRQAFNQLYGLGFKIRDPRNLGEKHIRALVRKWEEDRLSASTIQGRISVLRTFAGWIGKSGMVKSAEYYVDKPDSVRRSTVTRVDKTWAGHDIDPIEKITEISKYDKHVGAQLLLEYTFGLRTQEAWMLRPHLAHDQSWLRITRGAKGGCERSFPLRHKYEFETLELAKHVAGQKGASMMPASYSIKRWKDHYYRVLRKYDIGRNSTVTAHGLRHERLNTEYYDLTGFWMSIKGGKKGEVNKTLDDAAREHISRIAGHSRNEIVGAYGGQKYRTSKEDKDDTKK